MCADRQGTDKQKTWHSAKFRLGPFPDPRREKRKREKISHEKVFQRIVNVCEGNRCKRDGLEDNPKKHEKRA